MTTTKTKSPEHAAAFAAYCDAEQALVFAEMDLRSAEYAYLSNANRYSHGVRKSQAMRRAKEAAASKVEAARCAAEAARAALRAVIDAETKARIA